MSKPLKLLLIAAFLNCLSWMILIPVWQYPDEQAHFAQVQYLAEKNDIPENNKSFDTSYEVSFSEKILGTERDEQGNNKFTYNPGYKGKYSENFWGLQEKEIVNLPRQARAEMVKNEATLNPPLYYKVSAFIYGLFSKGNLFIRVYAIRLLSTVFFLTLILVTFKTAQLLFPNNGLYPVLIASILAFKPMLVFATTGILPDSLVILFFSLFIFISIKLIKEGISFSKLFLLLLVIALGAATRQNFLIVLFIMPMVFLYQFIVKKSSRKSLILLFFTTTSVLYVASFFLPDLGFINRFDFPESSSKFPNPLSNLSYFDHMAWTIKHSVAEVWPWFWGVYKWLSLTLPPVTYRIINRVIPIILIGLILKVWSTLRKRDFKKDFSFYFLLFTVFVYFIGLTTFDYFYRRNNGYSFGIQGRYFFPPIMAVIIIMFMGFLEVFVSFFKKYSNFLVVLVAVLFIIFNDFSLYYVSSSYYDASSLKKFVIQASQYKPFFIKGYPIIFVLTFNLILQSVFIFYLLKNQNIISKLYEGSKRNRF